MKRESKTCAGCRKPLKGELNPNWKGGKIKHRKGYIQRHNPTHPRAKSNPYVFEHILVVEELLGRFLEKDETVHHINGVKDDNRPENLELWCKPHPTGIRAADALMWAEEIVKRYT